MSSCSLLAEFSRWLYFIVSILAVMNSFIHLHIQFQMSQCTELLEVTAGIQCIGRNLAWQDEDNFDLDTNKLFWRQTFSLSPEIFLDIWPPVIVSLIALSQHFETFKWDTISGDWGRSFLFILVWQLFTVVGYGSNFGVVVGFIGFGVAALYLVMCISLWVGLADTDIRDKPVLDLTEYIALCVSVGQQMKSDTSDINHENDEQHPLATSHYTDNAQAILDRLSITQPGATTTTAAGSTLKHKNQKAHHYSEIVENDIDSHDEDEEVSLSEVKPALIPPPAPALPTITPAETGHEIESEDGNYDGLNAQPQTTQK